MDEGQTDNEHGISIHAPREGGRLAFNQFPYSNYHISIHAPREGGDMAISMKLSLRC